MCFSTNTAWIMLVFMIASSHGQSMPTGCTYDGGLYECDYTTLSGSSLIPLQASGFSPIPQRLRLTGLPSNLNTAVFDTDFASLNYTEYDTNYPASLELKCSWDSSSVSLAAGFLANMDHIEDFKITNCDLGNIPANAFSDLGTLDKFMIENGTISSLGGGALGGVTIVRNTSVFPSYPKQHGAFILKNTKIASGEVPVTLFTGQTGLYELVLKNVNLTTVDAAMLGSGTANNIRYLDLSENRFSSLPSSLFSKLNNLGVITLYGFDITCSCSNLWFMQYAHENYLTLDGDIICDVTNKLAWEYYYSNCVSEESSCSGGIELMDACLSAIDLAGFSVGTITFILGWVVLGITIHTKKQLGPAKGKGNAKGKPKARSNASKKPPKNGWA